MQCITNPNRHSPVKHITHLDGKGRKWMRERVIASIDAKTNAFHVIDLAEHRSEVGVVYPGNRRPRYVFTHADGDGDNHLLAVPRIASDSGQLTSWAPSVALTYSRCEDAGTFFRRRPMPRWTWGSQSFGCPLGCELHGVPSGLIFESLGTGVAESQIRVL